MAKSIFSLLFSSSSSGSETGSKNDGKGSADLVSMGNEQAAQQIQLAKDKGVVKGSEDITPEKNVTQSEVRKYKSPKHNTSSKSKAVKFLKRQAKKASRNRTLEINDKTREAKDTLKSARRTTLNKKDKVNTIKEFIDQLPNETQGIIKDQIKRKVKSKDVEYDRNAKPVEKTTTQKTQEQISKRELLERKRGIYREQQTALRLAKLAAEKARAMVKAVRDRVLRKLKPQKPAVQQQPNTRTNEQKTIQNAYELQNRQNIRN